MVHKFIVAETHEGLYYIYPIEGPANDGIISERFNFTIENYKLIMITQFKAVTYNKFGELCFRTREDCQQAIDYLESLSLMNQLKKDYDDEEDDDDDIMWKL